MNADCAAGRHQYEEIQRVEATPTEDGEVAFRCTACGQQYTQILFATDHLWGEWVVVRQPTCTVAGERRRTCTRAMPHDEYGAIPALGHNYTASVTREPGCEEPGETTFVCSRCNDSYTEPIAAIEHTLEDFIAQEPCCLEPGARTFTCVHDCGHSYDEEIPAGGQHNFGEWVVEIPAEEGLEGLEARICLRSTCDERETRQLAALPVPENSFPAMDVVLVSANIGFTSFFLFLLIPYLLCFRHLKKRRSAVQRRDALRKEVEAHYGFS